MSTKSDSLNEPRRRHLRHYGKTYPRRVALTSPSPRWGEGRVAVLFSSATQIDNVFRLAAEVGAADALRESLRGRTVVGSIGPLQQHGVEPDLQPEHPKIGHLVAEIARQASALLERKRRG
jgi:uroporphyrinogen-III synthase